MIIKTKLVPRNILGVIWGEHENEFGEKANHRCTSFALKRPKPGTIHRLEWSSAPVFLPGRPGQDFGHLGQLGSACTQRRQGLGHRGQVAAGPRGPATGLAVHNTTRLLRRFGAGNGMTSFFAVKLCKKHHRFLVLVRFGW